MPSTGNLFPTADGFYDSALLTRLPGGQACNTVNCAAEVDEAPHDSDTTAIKCPLGTLNEKQSFTIDITSVPDGSTIDSIAVTSTAKKIGGGPNGASQVFCRVSGVDYNGVNSADHSTAFAEFSETITVGAAKAAVEIGWKANTGTDKEERLTQIRCVINYTEGGPTVGEIRQGPFGERQPYPTIPAVIAY